jgi:hypothetical protein
VAPPITGGGYPLGAGSVHPVWELDPSPARGGARLDPRAQSSSSRFTGSVATGAATCPRRPGQSRTARRPPALSRGVRHRPRAAGANEGPPWPAGPPRKIGRWRARPALRADRFSAHTFAGFPPGNLLPRSLAARCASPSRSPEAPGAIDRSPASSPAASSPARRPGTAALAVYGGQSMSVRVVRGLVLPGGSADDGNGRAKVPIQVLIRVPLRVLVRWRSCKRSRKRS